MAFRFDSRRGDGRRNGRENEPRNGRENEPRNGNRNEPRNGNRNGTRRGQSNVIGVALLLGVTVLALGSLTATIGSVIGAHAASADAARVADGLDGALDPVEATGRNRGRVAFTEGSLRTVERDLRVLDGDGVRHTVGVDALVFVGDGHRVAFAAGAIVRGRGAGADLVEPPPITVSRGSGGVVVVGAPRLGGHADVAGSGGVRITLRTDVRHNRTSLNRGRFGIAVETTTPEPWVEYFREQNATVSRRDFDDDGIESVVARFAGERQGYLVVHEMNLEVVA